MITANGTYMRQSILLIGTTYCTWTSERLGRTVHFYIRRRVWWSERPSNQFNHDDHVRSHLQNHQFFEKQLHFPSDADPWSHMLRSFTMMSPTPSASFGAVWVVARENYTQHLISRWLQGALSNLLATTFGLDPVLCSILHLRCRHPLRLLPPQKWLYAV